MPEDLSGTYEIVLPITLDPGEGPKTEGTVELSHEDAEAFLARGFVKEPESEEQEEAGGAENPGLASLDAVTRNLLVEAGLDTDEAVRVATNEAILDIEDVGEGRLAKIREALPGEEG